VRLPTPRGQRSQQLFFALESAPHATAIPWEASNSLEDDAIALWVLHELHYRGFDEVDDAWEWTPSTLTLRHSLEGDLEARLRARRPEPVRTGDVTRDLLLLIESHDGPSLARHVQTRSTKDQAVALLQQRSLYHLKEADPTSWVIPRLGARPKSALLELQFDEYGNGDPARLHHHLFADGLATSGLCAEYGAYVDDTLLPVLEQNNVLSMFGLHRRLRGAALGHLAAFEATSSIPSRQLAQGLRRLGFSDEMACYYDEHVEADAVHEQLALRDICAGLVDDEPHLADDVLFGAWACLDLEVRTANELLRRWGCAA